MTDTKLTIDVGKGESKYFNGFSIENIQCEEFIICAKARENFGTFKKYCISKDYEICPYRALTTDMNDQIILDKHLKLN